MHDAAVTTSEIRALKRAFVALIRKWITGTTGYFQDAADDGLGGVVGESESGEADGKHEWP